MNESDTDFSLSGLEDRISKLAHELRNPLTSLKVRLFSIHRAVAEDPKLDAKFRIVFEELDRLENILNKNLDSPNLSASKLRPPGTGNDSEEE